MATSHNFSGLSPWISALNFFSADLRDNKKNSSEIDESCLNLWYPCSFHSGRYTYKSVGHFVILQKARMCENEEIEDDVMRLASFPEIIKDLGDKLAIDQRLWDRERVNKVISGSHYKFSQNPLLEEFLLSTGDKVLVYADPLDNFYGIGLEERDSRITSPSLWRGENKLGFALMEVREIIRKEKEKMSKR